MRIYEQLEVSIQDLERANHRLAVENATDKKQIKNLTSNIETLETKCEELQGCVEDLKNEIDAHKRRVQKAQEQQISSQVKNEIIAPSSKTQNDNNRSSILSASHRNQVI